LSSGKGDLSRLYKTTDGCKTWKLVFTNADKNGFWDALKFTGKTYGTLIGDPVNGYFSIFETHDGGLNWDRQKNVGAGCTPLTVLSLRLAIPVWSNTMALKGSG
jgi:Uncharacterized protein related to plant photosystem II stability/assembly factor